MKLFGNIKHKAKLIKQVLKLESPEYCTICDKRTYDLCANSISGKKHNIINITGSFDITETIEYPNERKRLLNENPRLAYKHLIFEGIVNEILNKKLFEIEMNKNECKITMQIVEPQNKPTYY